MIGVFLKEPLIGFILILANLFAIVEKPVPRCWSNVQCGVSPDARRREKSRGNM